ncbi:hypothetical protein AM588_10010605 [Phytophthora nicotianae]|uniref:Uncharacterized protein n=1 Tax=Phytophthora nicotianae TaxID=4792 RepID=A0A0W8DI13_PHYNI|nr:hypothetical protein AM588_10010605 [Phytophthora nicotianae]
MFGGVQVEDDASNVITRQVFNHPGEVLSLAPSPQDPQLLVSCGKQRGQQAEASLWKLPDAEANSSEEDGATVAQDLEQLAVFPAQKLPVSERNTGIVESFLDLVVPLVELDERDLMDETAGGAAVADTLIRRIEEHEDAVYAARWATGGDAWMFVSVSYDGRLAVNHVPSTEKYKILL